MTRRSGFLVAVLLVSGVLASLRAPARATDYPQRPETPAYGQTPPELVPYNRSIQPYRRFYLTPPEFRGPGRELPDPPGLKTVRIGLLAPLEGAGEVAAGTSLKRGVDLALEEANASGGYHGLPFELVPRNDQQLWGSAASTLLRFGYEDGVWAVIGSIDNNSTHVALRAAVKAEILIVNVGSSDPTMNETGIPWIVRCWPDDRQTSYRVARLVFEEKKYARVAVIRSGDRYGRTGIKEFRDAARRLSRPVPMEVLFSPGEKEFTTQIDRVEGAKVEAVVVWASQPADAARLVRKLRQRGMRQPIIGTDHIVNAEFLERAGEAAEGVVATYPYKPDREDERWTEFRKRFSARYTMEPDPYAAYGYDAAQMVIGGLREVGLNRPRLRDALMAVRHRSGVTGEELFDETSNDVSPLALARVEGGRFVFE